MLEWIAAACFMILMAILWPVVKCIGAESHSTLLLPRRESKRSAERCDSKIEGQGESDAVALICKPSALANYLLKHCMSFCKSLSIPKWNWRMSSSLQTLFGALWPFACPVHFIRDHLQLSDDGLVALDWAVVGAAHHKRRRTSSNSTSPVLLIIPNSFGKITRNVLKVLVFLKYFPPYLGVKSAVYKTVLGELVHTDNLFSSCTLKAMEEALFCHSGLKGMTTEGAGSWEAYWEHNDPLRDIDEVAIPVLCVCSQDDPIRGDPQTTLPLELFESNPHFFLLLTAHGGHCGFSTSDEGPIVWSHQAVLEFFRATTDFFAAEERAKLAARRRGLSGAGKTFRHRSVSTCKRLPVCPHNIHTIYNWQRSYTR
uniref:Abhydrolase domain containing 15a n=1 Tax=Sinocyclocheilus anshuiensis TaxID=1608454 RepID=A0A671KWF5_9TELE